MIDQTHAVIERSGITGTQVGGLMAVAGGFTLNTWLGIERLHARHPVVLPRGGRQRVA